MGNKAGFDDDKLFDIAEVDLDRLTGTPDSPDVTHEKIYIKDGQLQRKGNTERETNLEKIRISSNDASDDYLPGKLEAGPGITFTPLYDGSAEKLKAEVNNTVGTSRLNAACGKTGNAGTNTYLEFFRAISSADSPLIIAEAGELKSVSVSMKNSTTVTFSIQKNGSEIETLTVTSDKKGSKIGISEVLAVEDELSVVVSSGSGADVIFFLSILVYI